MWLFLYHVKPDEKANPGKVLDRISLRIMVKATLKEENGCCAYLSYTITENNFYRGNNVNA